MNTNIQSPRNCPRKSSLIEISTTKIFFPNNNRQFSTIISFCLLLICVNGDSCGSINLNKNGEYCSICQNKSAFVNCTRYYLNGKSLALSQSDCTYNCCNSSSVSIPSQITICSSQAQAASEDDPNTTIEVVMLVVFFTLPAGMCIYLICSCCRKRRSADEQSAQQPGETNRDSKSQIINIEEINMNAIAPYYLQSDLQCSICLDAKCDIMTRCGHFFHLECLNVWVKRSQKCPLCVSTKVNPIVHYCYQCFKSVKLGIIDQKKRISQIAVLKEHVLCEDCQLRKEAKALGIKIDDISDIGQEKSHKNSLDHHGQSSKSLVRS